MLRIKAFIGPHHGHQILRIAQIDDIVCIARQHMHRLDLFSGHFEFDHFIGPDLSFLDQGMTGYDDEDLPLAVVPVLYFRNAWFRNIDTVLSMIACFQQLGKAASFISVHLQIKADLFLWQIGQIR